VSDYGGPPFNMNRAILRRGFYTVYYPVSRLFLKLERLVSWREVRHWVDHTPPGLFTGISFDNYTWWIYNQGLFSGLIASFTNRTNLKILDWGCGMGKLAPVCSFFVKDGGKYLGVDTEIRAIEQCRRMYVDLKNCEFYLTKDQNAYYANPGVSNETISQIDWPVTNNSQDLLLASSVFTHLQEAESVKYLQKVYEVLAPGGLALLTFHIIRDYVNTNPTFNFTHQLTPGWYTSDLKCPEHAIGITMDTLKALIRGRFAVEKMFEGTSTGGSGPSFQDLFVFRKN
jgi:SAM-dependent methyltransferase